MSNPNNWLSYQTYTSDSPTNLFRKLDAECTEPSELVHLVRDNFGQYTAVTRPKDGETQPAKRAYNRKKTEAEQHAETAAGTGGDTGSAPTPEDVVVPNPEGQPQQQ